MKLEDQVCSLELAKRLRELGVKQESYFEWSYWTDHAAAENNTGCHEKHWEVTDQNGGNIGGRISAFTVAELGEMLPEYVPSYKHKNKWRCLNQGIPLIADSDDFFDDETEANVRAKMLIHMIENKLMTAAPISAGER